MNAAEAVSAELRQAAELALAYLAKTDPAPDVACDAIIGFGVFDLSLPRFCGELCIRGIAPRIIFTGGLGAGTGNLGGAEALVWREELRRAYPDIPDGDVILETASTNTTENIGFTAELLARSHPALRFGTGIRCAVIVASPSRLRRVQLAMQRWQPQVEVVRLLPPLSFESEYSLYAKHGIDYIGHLRGELDRIVDYPARGWIAPESLPPEIVQAHAVLRSHPA